VWRTELNVSALAKRLFVQRDDRADERIRRNAAGAQRGQLDRTRQMACIRF
jgi:hypothetical protein